MKIEMILVQVKKTKHKYDLDTQRTSRGQSIRDEVDKILMELKEKFELNKIHCSAVKAVGQCAIG